MSAGITSGRLALADQATKLEWQAESSLSQVLTMHT